ncbi:MAG: AraC family transcriptional regulator [Gammaproteobacteria bacterium]|nr:AraC family transcriptional regulator [Gammaproteobacteria bacterium]
MRTPRAPSDRAASGKAEYLYGNTMLRRQRLAYGLAPVIAVLERYRHAISPLLAASGIPRFAIEEPSYRILFDQELVFIRSALAVLQLPAAGLEVGREYNLALFGVLGLAASCAPTVRELFRTVPSYPSLAWGCIEQAVWREGSEEYVAFYTNDQVGDCAPFFVERDITATLNLFRQTLGEQVVPVSVRFAHSPPSDCVAYERFFRCPLHFSDTVNEIRFARAVWDAAPPQANPMAYRFFINQCRRLSTVMDEPLSYADVIRVRLRTTTPMPSLGSVIEDLHLTARTLQRRLQEERTDFATLLREVRIERARELLARGGMHNDEIAHYLGFGDSSAFSRAFKSWTGQSPYDFRRDHDDGQQ